MSEDKNNTNDVNFQELFATYEHLVYKIASSFRKKGVCNFIPYEDLVQEGYAGLLDAITRYNLGCLDESYKAYVFVRIKGAIIDALRSNAKISRFTCDNIKKVEKIISSLSQKLLRQPMSHEVEQALLLDGFCERVETDVKEVFVEEEFFDIFISDFITPESITLDNERVDILNKLICAIKKCPNLNKTERYILNEVIKMFFFDKKSNLQKIADEIDRTESAVCIARKKLLKKIRLYLETDHPELIEYISS